MSPSRRIDWSIYTPFQQRVFRVIMKIPKGRVLTYGQVATKMGNKKWARAVGQALAKNQHAPAIPCHRVVGYNSMGGYSAEGGVKRKAKLLLREGHHV
ncbi:MAG: MGMT family protein [Candidatus Doudnabacteria bacterium]|nr:MGMT family protein [Candidatus Doudnabacteria bacterium]